MPHTPRPTLTAIQRHLGCSLALAFRVKELTEPLVKERNTCAALAVHAMDQGHPVTHVNKEPFSDAVKLAEAITKELE